MPSQQRVPLAGGSRSVGGGNVQPGLAVGVGEMLVLGAAAAAAAVDTDGAAADGASLGWSHRGRVGNHDLSVAAGDWAPG